MALARVVAEVFADLNIVLIKGKARSRSVFIKNNRGLSRSGQIQVRNRQTSDLLTHYNRQALGKRMCRNVGGTLINSLELHTRVLEPAWTLYCFPYRSPCHTHLPNVPSHSRGQRKTASVTVCIFHLLFMTLGQVLELICICGTPSLHGRCTSQHGEHRYSVRSQSTH